VTKTQKLRIGSGILLAKATGRPRPFFVQYSLLNACNASCVYCNCPRRENPRASTDDHLRVLREFARLGAARIKFLGGEPLLRADIDRLRGRLEVNVGSASTARRIFVAAARSVAADDPERALEMTVAATLLGVYDAEARRDAAADVSIPVPRAAAADGSAAAVLGPLLDALTADAEGRQSDALASLDAAVRSSHGIAPEQRALDPTQWRSCAGSEPDVVANIGNTAVELGQDTIARDCFTRVLAAGRTSGAVTVVLYALPRLAFPQLLLGDWTSLRQGMQEAVELARVLGQPALTAAPHAWLALLAALQGDPAYDHHRDRATEAGERLGALTSLVGDLRRWAAAVGAAGAGDHAGALHQYASMQVPALRRMTATERIAEAARAGERDHAEGQLVELSAFASASRLPWALAAAQYGSALLTEPTQAAEHFAAALMHHEESGRVVDRARVQLTYGESLRRWGKRVEARAQLRSALATFEDLDAEPLAARAREELRASGETARKRDPSTLVALTPMETQVAQLVAQGLSNKEVAAQLWISPRTVAFHLRGVFAKLGVSSRGALQALSLA
jgi:DNA-binding CsgD family transcriptional regulator